MVDRLSSAQYDVIVTLLLVPDAALLHTVLETLYTLTSIGSLLQGSL